MMLIDRWFLHAMSVLIVLMLCASCGLIHAEKLSLRYTSRGTLTGSEAMADTLGDGVRIQNFSALVLLLLQSAARLPPQRHA